MSKLIKGLKKLQLSQLNGNLVSINQELGFHKDRIRAIECCSIEVAIEGLGSNFMIIFSFNQDCNQGIM